VVQKCPSNAPGKKTFLVCCQVGIVLSGVHIPDKENGPVCGLSSNTVVTQICFYCRFPLYSRSTQLVWLLSTHNNQIGYHRTGYAVGEGFFLGKFYEEVLWELAESVSSFL